MVKLVNILLILGVLVFAATSALFLYHFNQTGFPLVGDTIGMTASGAFSCFAIFMRRRVIQGIPIFEMTVKDKTQLQEARRQLNIWRLLARLLGGFGAIAWVAGIMSFLNLDSSGKPDWKTGVVCFVFGGILIIPAILIGRRDNFSR